MEVAWALRPDTPENNEPKRLIDDSFLESFDLLAADRELV
jgi:hypothetical protein